MANTPWFETAKGLGDRTLAQQMLGLGPLVNAVRGKTVLDIGCAEGLISMALLKRGAMLVHGVEIMPGRVYSARELCARKPTGTCNFVVGDVNTFEPKLSYDIILMLAILHKLKKPDVVCKRLAAAAKQLCVIRIPAGFGHSIVDTRSGMQPFDLDRIMADEGFSLEQETTSSFDEVTLFYKRDKMMIYTDGWFFPNGERHLPAWMANPKVRMTLNGRAAYQGAKQMAALAQCKRFRHAIDVGGHVGLWSYNLAYAFDHVDAFEPVAVHAACFEKNVLDYLDNVTLHRCALGNRKDFINIRTEPTSSGDSRVDGAGDIPMYLLDDFNFKDIDLIKIDTEGTELFVLQGAIETIKLCKPVIIVEQKPGHAQKYGLGERAAVPYLKRLGMSLISEMSGDFIMVFK